MFVLVLQYRRSEILIILYVSQYTNLAGSSLPIFWENSKNRKQNTWFFIQQSTAQGVHLLQPTDQKRGLSITKTNFKRYTNKFNLGFRSSLDTNRSDIIFIVTCQGWYSWYQRRELWMLLPLLCNFAVDRKTNTRIDKYLMRRYRTDTRRLVLVYFTFILIGLLISSWSLHHLLSLLGSLRGREMPAWEENWQRRANVASSCMFDEIKMKNHPKRHKFLSCIAITTSHFANSFEGNNDMNQILSTSQAS